MSMKKTLAIVPGALALAVANILFVPAYAEDAPAPAADAAPAADQAETTTELPKIEVRDRKVASAVAKCQAIPGQNLFQYKDDEGDFRRPIALRLPGGEGTDVVLLDALAVAVAHERLEDDAEARGQAGQPSEAFLFELREGVEGPDLSGRGGKRLARAVEGAHRFIVLRGPGRDA